MARNNVSKMDTIHPKTIALMLLENKNQQQMADELHVSRMTISSFIKKFRPEIEKYREELVDNDFSSVKDLRREILLKYLNVLTRNVDYLEQQMEDDNIKTDSLKLQEVLQKSVNIDMENPFENAKVEIKITRG